MAKDQILFFNRRKVSTYLTFATIAASTGLVTAGAGVAFAGTPSCDGQSGWSEITPGVCETRIDFGASPFAWTPASNVNKLEAVLVGAGGTANSGYGGGGGAVTWHGFSDLTDSLTVNVGDATGTDETPSVGTSPRDTNIYQNSTLVSYASGGHDPEAEQGAYSGNGNLGVYDAIYLAGGGGSGAEGNGVDAGAGSVVDSLAPGGSLFSGDEDCYGGGGAVVGYAFVQFPRVSSYNVYPLYIGTASCGGGSISDTTTIGDLGENFSGGIGDNQVNTNPTNGGGGAAANGPIMSGLQSGPTVNYHQTGANGFVVLRFSYGEAPASFPILYNQGTQGSGTGPISPVTVNSGDTFTVPDSGYTANPGYTFAGWSDGSATYTVGSTYPSSGTVSETVTLTALWSPETFTVSYANGGHGSGSPAYVPTQLNYGDTFTLPANGYTPNVGYNFVGWSDGSATYTVGSTYPATGTVSSNVSLTALWQLETFTVTYAPGAHGSGTAPASQTVNYGDTFTVEGNTFAGNSGYSFNGWSDGSATYTVGSRYPSTGIVTSNVVLTALWITSAQQETITYCAGEHGSGSAPVSPRNVNYGATFTVPDNSYIANTGYTFKYWSDGHASYLPGSTYPATGTVTRNVNLTAIWQVQSETITYQAGTQGNGGGPTSPLSVNYGSTFRVPANTYSGNTGFVFAGWSDGSATYTVGATYPSHGTVTGPVTLTALWKTQVATETITYLPGAHGGGTAPSSPRSVNYGSTFRVPSNTFSANSGYAFVGWSDGSATYTVGSTYPATGVVTGNVTLTALWRSTAPALSITCLSPSSGSTRGGTSITITGTGFNSGATVKIDGTLVTVVSRNGSTQIVVRTNAHAAGRVSLVVTNPDTTTASTYFTFTSTNH